MIFQERDRLTVENFINVVEFTGALRNVGQTAADLLCVRCYEQLKLSVEMDEI